MTEDFVAQGHFAFVKEQAEKTCSEKQTITVTLLNVFENKQGFQAITVLMLMCVKGLPTGIL